jgi:hypothetical protein
MSPSVRIEVEIPDDLARVRSPDGVQERVHMLLDNPQPHVVPKLSKDVSAQI